MAKQAASAHRNHCSRCADRRPAAGHSQSAASRRASRGVYRRRESAQVTEFAARRRARPRFARPASRSRLRQLCSRHGLRLHSRPRSCRHRHLARQFRKLPPKISTRTAPSSSRMADSTNKRSGATLTGAGVQRASRSPRPLVPSGWYRAIRQSRLSSCRQRGWHLPAATAMTWFENSRTSISNATRTRDPAMQSRIHRVAGAPMFAVARTDRLPPSIYAPLHNSPQLEQIARSVQAITLAGQLDR